MAFTVEGTGEHPTLQPRWMSGDLDLPGPATIANGVILILANGDRASTALPGGRGRGPGGRGGPPRTIPLTEVNPNEPGYERDAAWRAAQLKPFEEGGQKPGERFSGGRETTHAVLYALDPATGDELYSSGNAIDSWNHDGSLAISDGNIFISTWDARVFAFGLKK
jgi:outer membrane protein assembly factor BamB